MPQLPFALPTGRGASGRGPLDGESEALLARFVAVRVAEGAAAPTVAREVSQLRSLAREAGTEIVPMPLALLVADLPAVARALGEPRATIARATGRARLIAMQRFIRIVGPLRGRDTARDLQALDTLLPSRPQRGWYDRGTIVGGSKRRRRGPNPTLSALDLARIVAAMPDDAGDFPAVRDRALVALHCYSGLRAGEIVALQWEQVRWCEPGEAWEVTVMVERGGRRLCLAVLGPGVAALRSFAEATQRRAELVIGPVFRRSALHRQSLSYRAARTVLVHACRAAGYPAVESVTLRAAFASWLGVQGLSDHEVAAVLGNVRVRSVDRLLARQRVLDSQRIVRERL